MSFNQPPSRKLAKGFGLLAIAFVLFTALVTMLLQIGLPSSTAAALFVIVTFTTFMTIGFVSRTMQLSDFQVAGRSISPALNGMATAAAFLASAGFLGLAGAFFGGGDMVLAVVAGWTVGFLALSVLIAPYFRRTAAVSVADFLAIRFSSRVVRLAAAVVTVACCFAFLVAEITAAGLVAARLLGITVDVGIGIAVIVILAGSLLGGMRAVTLTAIAQYIVAIVAFLTPVIILSVQIYDLPVPQLAFGYALESITELGGSATEETMGRFLALPPLDGFNMVVLALCLAAGIASMPTILMRSATSDSVGAARLSAGWGLFFVLVVISTAPAYAAFARLALLADPSSGPLAPDTIVLALPMITGLSPAMTALVATGALAAILAAATALLFAISQTIGHDFYAGLLDGNGPPSRQLIVTRIFLIVVACLAGWYATRQIDDIFSLAATSLSLAASGLFPAVLLAIWWKRATAPGALVGIVLGFAAAASYIVMVIYGDLAPWQPMGSAGTGLPPMAAAFFGIPVGLLSIILVSHISRPPAPERVEIVEALRRPTPSPLFDV